MSDQDDLFPGFFSGESLKDAGTAQVLENNEDYCERFEDAAAQILALYGQVSSEDVIREIGMPSGHPNAVGASMRSFAARNHLHVSGYKKALRPSCHAAIIAIWKP